MLLRPVQVLRFLAAITLLIALSCAPRPAERTQDTAKPGAKASDKRSNTGVTGADDSVEDMAAEKGPPPAQSPDQSSARPREPVPQATGNSVAASVPKRPVTTWAIFQSAYKPEDAADINAEWLGGRQIRVTTQNVNRLTLDFTKLPAGAPKDPHWNLTIDRQAIEITGGRGLVLDFDRSPNGIWSVDKKRAAPRRSSR